MLKPEIIGSSRSTYTRVVRMVCAEKGIEYEFKEAELGAPEIFAIHPFGKMPVMRHGDVELFESKAIAAYLDRCFPGPTVFPSDPLLGALTEQWVSLVNTVIDRTAIRTYLLAYAAPKTADGKPDRQAIDAVTPALREQIGRPGQGGRQDRLSGRRSVHIRRHQSHADPLLHAARPRRR